MEGKRGGCAKSQTPIGPRSPMCERLRAPRTEVSGYLPSDPLTHFPPRASHKVRCSPRTQAAQPGAGRPLESAASWRSAAGVLDHSSSSVRGERREGTTGRVSRCCLRESRGRTKGTQTHVPSLLCRRAYRALRPHIMDLRTDRRLLFHTSQSSPEQHYITSQHRQL